MLYQKDLNESSVDPVLQRWRSYRGELGDYALAIVRGVDSEVVDLDARLEEASVGWPVHRMSVVDRTILRLALYEILHVEDVPAEVAVNEAVELAKGFSGEDSPVFVGGVLRGVQGSVQPVEHG
jgi:N utilization substance protein B